VRVVAIVGTRHITKAARLAVRGVLTGLNPYEHLIITGDCPTGVDAYVLQLAKELGFEFETHHAGWKTFGKPAGPRRNSRIIDRGRPDEVYAIVAPSSRGSWDTVNKARAAGLTDENIHVIRVTP
jgi:hypothetical protein